MRNVLRDWKPRNPSANINKQLSLQVDRHGQRNTIIQTLDYTTSLLTCKPTRLYLNVSICCSTKGSTTSLNSVSILIRSFLTDSDTPVPLRRSSLSSLEKQTSGKLLLLTNTLPEQIFRLAETYYVHYFYEFNAEQ